MIKPIILDKLNLNKDKILFVFSGFILFLISHIMRINFIIPLFLLCIFIYLKAARLKYNFLHALFLYVLIFVISYHILKNSLPVYYIPFSLIPMLAMMLFSDFALSLLIALIAAVTVSYLSSNNQLGMLFLVSGISSIITVSKARSRGRIIRAGFIVGLLQAIALFCIYNFKMNHTYSYVMFLLNGIVCGMLMIAFLPIFEYLFNTVTNISLLELADFNHPLLQRMVLETPGTYHHSLVVGNLSEAAAKAVGANALLARIGAYYHDIGKLQKPQYYSENQGTDEGKHENLTPTMSKMIIMNHVNEGVELAKDYKLNSRLVDFIRQHHGTSLVYYFYRRALEGLEEDQEVMEEGFRYPGPKPNTKETAIVLLADSVEAATRALKIPDSASVKNIVHKIINNKFIDGQLDECDLALADLEKISDIFVRILTGIYHARVSYPESKKSGNNHKESAKENSHQSQKDKASGS